MPVSNRLTYNPSSPGGRHIAAAIANATIALQEANRAFALAASVTAGGATQANLENSPEFGGGVGQGPVLYSALLTLQADLVALNTAALLGNLDAG